MERSQLEQLLSDQWKGSVSSSCDALERDDLRQVSVFNSWDDVQKQIHDGQNDQSSHQEFAMLAPALMKLRTFTDFWIRQLVPKLDTSMFWGLVRLVVKVGAHLTYDLSSQLTEVTRKLAREEHAAIARVSRMLRGLCHQIEIVNNYCAEAQSLTTQLKESCVEIGLVLLSFFSYAIKFMRSGNVYSTYGQSLDSEWQPLEEQFSSTSRAVGDSLSRIEKLSRFFERSERMDDSVRRSSGSISLTKQSSVPEEQAKLPCVILPSIRTSRFFDRTDVIRKMEDHFKRADSEGSFQSLALYGLGGVGKSSVALRYAEARLQRNELDALFWIYSEKLVSIRQSFSDIAVRLKLPDARPGDHDENHALVLNWLQHTQCRWLIVYDNAEAMDLIRAHWPLASRGQALITTRNHSFAFEPADGGLEIKTWDTETGSRFLLHLLSTDIGAELKNDEATSAQELSQKLSGHALAISHMAGLIHRRAWSIAEFINIYNQHPSEMHGVSGNSSINALWDFAFKSLDQHSRALLGALCYVAPDNIPQSLFELKRATDLPEALSFCSDHLRFAEAIENLLTLALIKRDKDSRTFSLHRLVQMSFKYFMTTEQRQQSFNDAATLVSHAFPRRDSNVAQLYLMWVQCAMYLQHVVSLKDCFREEKKLNPNFTALKTYCDLNNACQRYLLEINAYDVLAELIEVNTVALNTLLIKDQTIGLQGSLTSHRGQLLVRLGRPFEGVEWLRKSYELRSHDIPLNPRESGWAAENAGNGVATLNDFAEAIKWQTIARDHWQEWSNKQPFARGDWPACMKKSMGMNLVWAGRSKEARDISTLALQQIESTDPYNWAMAAYTHFALGTIDRADLKFESAEAHFMEAQNLWFKGDQLRTDPFNAACMYRLGCTALDQGKLEAAIKHLRDAMVVTDMRKIHMVAEHARCLFKLSEALEQEPRDQQEAWRLREEAERLLRKRAPDAAAPSLESTYDSLVNILWR